MSPQDPLVEQSTRQAATLHRLALILFVSCFLLEFVAMGSTQLLPETEAVMMVVGIFILLGFLGFFVGLVVGLVAFTKARPRRWSYLVVILLNGLFSLGACCFVGLAAFLDGWKNG